jgi:hypothetical protein
LDDIKTNSDCRRGNHAHRCIIADIEFIIYYTPGKQYNLFTTKEYESTVYCTPNRHANRYTAKEIYSKIYCTQNRHANRFTTEEIYLTTCCTELEASTLAGTTQPLSCVYSTTVEWF